MDFEKDYPKTEFELEDLYDDAAFTIEGLVDDDSNLNDFAEWINEKCGANNITFHIISGKTMNRVYQLFGDNAYPNDLTIVAATGDLDPSKLAVARFDVGARWFNDIVDNNAERKSDSEDNYYSDDDYED